MRVFIRKAQYFKTLAKKRQCERFIEYVSTSIEETKNPRNADAIFVFGGDGAMLNAIGKYWHCNKPFYGFNFGSEGFLMNRPNRQALHEILQGESNIIQVRMLAGKFFDRERQLIATKLAFNDIYIERAKKDTTKVRIRVDGVTYVQALICDAIIIATPAGSTAYSGASGGHIIHVENGDAMVITAAAPALRYRWRNGQLANTAKVTLSVLDYPHRPARILYDGNIVRRAVSVKISYSDQIVQLGLCSTNTYRSKVNKLLFSHKQ